METIDIIIPVYNALSETKRCIQSILSNTSQNFRLVIINDCSDYYTSEYLEKVSKDHSKILLINNEKNLGFLHTVNKGLSLDLDNYQAPFKIILNSDTIVPDNWLQAFFDCFNSDEKIALASPISNNAENLSVEIPKGYDFYSFSKLVEKEKVESYPDVTTIVGFCLAFKTKILREEGLFDKIFSPGYAEESDYHFRMIVRSYRAVLIPNLFVYHESHASFSEKKQALVKRNRPIFDERWKTIYLNELNYELENNPVKKIGNHLHKLAENQDVEYDLVFFIPTLKLFGGIIIVCELVNRLLQKGKKASVVVFGEEEKSKMNLLFTPVFINPADYLEDLPKSKIYVTTIFNSIEYAFMAKHKYPKSKIMSLVQGYEGWFPHSDLGQVIDTYKAIPNKVCVSNWLKDMISKYDKNTEVIPNGIDVDFFVPAENAFNKDELMSKSRLVLFTLLREDPQNGWKIALEVLKRIKSENLPIDVIAVGNKTDDPEIKRLCKTVKSSADRKEIRKFFQQADLFLDSSIIQGFGLMPLEGMACGVASLITKCGGFLEYANENNSRISNLADVDQIMLQIKELIDNREKLLDLKLEGRKTAVNFSWDETIEKYLAYITELLNEDDQLTTENMGYFLNYLYKERKKSRALENSILVESQNRISDLKNEVQDDSLLAKVISICN